jgi:hypothetical protein
MIDLSKIVQEQLFHAGYSVGLGDDADAPFIMFENASVLGFVLFYPDAGALIERWRGSSERVLKAAQFALRRAEEKSWNTYLLLLAEGSGTYGQSITLGTIEEDLVGTRKIARAGIASVDDAHAALLPLLPIQNAPQLDAVDMPTEIRLRTSELGSNLVEAFLSGATEATLSQLLETN